ncbi:MAG: hypothetical protein WA476_19495 [Acidobacteriaceae bacterium]
MSALLQDRYQLKFLHEEIDLFDRKLAHLLRYEEFPCDADRDAAAKRLMTKRELLARSARQMAKDGIEFNASELPRSFRTEPEAAAAPTVAAVAADDAPVTPRKVARARAAQPSPYAGTSLDFRKGLQEYKKKKSKV